MGQEGLVDQVVFNFLLCFPVEDLPELLVPDHVLQSLLAKLRVYLRLKLNTFQIDLFFVLLYKDLLLLLLRQESAWLHLRGWNATAFLKQ